MRQPAVVFVFIALLIDVLSLGLIIPVLPKLVESFMGGDTARAAEMYGLFGMAWALMQFLCSPLLGAASDHFGRRPVLLFSCLGLGLDFVLMALAPDLTWLLIGRIISGITASSMSVAGAYIADVTPPEKRAGSYGLIGAAWGIGFVVGPAMGGLLGSIDPRLPFWAAAVLALANTAYGFFVLPESLPKDKRAPFRWSRANPVGALKLLRSHPELAGLASVSVLYTLAHFVLPSTFVLYTGYRYGWDAQTVGLTLALVGVCNVIVQAVLVKRIVGALGERRALLLGLAAGTLGFVGYGLAATPLQFWLVIPVFAFMGLYGTAAQAIMTRRVSAQEQGQLQGANSSILGICGIVAPGLFTQTFAYFIGEGSGLHLPGAPLLLAGLLVAAALPLAVRVTRPAGPQSP